MEEGPVKPKVEETASDSSVGDRGQKLGKGKNSKSAVEPPKDYVHVRARRGQATDSHSLAERVRRERISQRMKVLQDLVPGCNKVVGKALMLDEIINYVQSLQQQVEFLSMKLATVNPQLDFGNLSTLLHKDMYQACGHSVSSIFPLDERVHERTSSPASVDAGVRFDAASLTNEFFRGRGTARSALGRK